MKIELYQKDHCSYSARVRKFIDDHHLRSRVEYRFTDHNAMSLALLRDFTGRDQVPVLVVNGEPISDSEKIIAWLDENLVKRTNAA